MPISKNHVIHQSDIELYSKLYKSMLNIRLIEEKISEIYSTDKIQSPVHLSIGQEAVSAGVCLALKPSDHIYGTYRGHGIYIAKGGNLKKLFAELYGKNAGCARGKGGSMHLVAPEVGLMGCSAIVSSTIPVATGDALASHMQGRKRVVVSFFGDGAVDEGVFFESINFALLKNLPIIFVCENNRYAIHSKISDRRKETRLFKIVEGLGLSGVRLDGNDVGIVYKTMKDAVEAIRNGGGPVLLEYMTLRWKEHVGPNEDLNEIYREEDRHQYVIENDPIARAEIFLKNEFKVSDNKLKQLREEIMGDIEEAVVFAEESPFPELKNLYENLYKERQ